uniref:Uncharacterized protein n=1 Tax=uncultured Segetibacter sp. TaxID=481133 RepID=A0A6J4TNL6_9BACT|nr:MAG: hypothetical protein AVDCRST_MAG96-3313 [uncultured Segetibacter sp.]
MKSQSDDGKEADIKRSWKDLSAKFNVLGLEHAPVTKQHFRHLHHQIFIHLSRTGSDFLLSKREKLVNVDGIKMVLPYLLC